MGAKIFTSVCLCLRLLFACVRTYVYGCGVRVHASRPEDPPGNERRGIKDPPIVGRSPVSYHPPPQPHPFRQISEANQLVVLETF